MRSHVPDVDVTATWPPEPPYTLLLTMTIAWCHSGTCALSTFSTVALLAVSRRRIAPLPQNVASKYVATTAPVPAQLGVAGSSAPLSVEVTSMRKTLIEQRSVRSSNGGTANSA